MSSEIICEFCKQPYTAFNSKRSHCNKPGCRKQAISGNLRQLEAFFGMLLRHKIVAEVEIRCPGNDSFGTQVKTKTEGHLGRSGIQNADSTAGFGQLDALSDYFRPILMKRIKGNFFVRTLATGRLDMTVVNEGFSDLEDPVVMGNNLFVSQKATKKPVV